MALNDKTTPAEMAVIAKKIATYRELASQKKLIVMGRVKLDGKDAFVFHLLKELRDTGDISDEGLALHLMKLGMMMEMARLHKRLAKSMFGEMMEGIF